MMHYVYMTKDLYKQLYEEEPSYDMMLIDLAEDQVENEEAIGRTILDQPAAYAMTYVSTNRETIEQMLGSLNIRSEEHTSELQSRFDLVCRLLLEKKKIKIVT